MDRLQSGLDGLLAAPWVKRYMLEIYRYLNPWFIRSSGHWRLVLSTPSIRYVEIRLCHDADYVGITVHAEVPNTPWITIRLSPGTGVERWSQISRLRRITSPEKIYWVRACEVAPSSLSRLMELFAVLLGHERRRLI